MKHLIDCIRQGAIFRQACEPVLPLAALPDILGLTQELYGRELSQKCRSVCVQSQIASVRWAIRLLMTICIAFSDFRDISENIVTIPDIACRCSDQFVAISALLLWT
jgi:hypothetical protein